MTSAESFLMQIKRLPRRPANRAQRAQAAHLPPAQAGMRSHVKHMVIALVSVGLMWALFDFALDVILPTGSLFGNFI